MFEAFKEQIKAFRKQEMAKDWPTYQLCLDLIRAKHGITETEAQRKKKGKKCKRSVVEEEKEEEEDNFVEDESDDEFDDS